MIITPSIKPQKTPKIKSPTLCASAGASQCEDKVKKGSRHVTGCCSCFYDYNALRLAAKLYSCKFDSSNSQFIHHCRDSVNTYLLQLAAAGHCGEKHQIHSLNYILWLKCSIFHKNIKSIKLPRQQKTKTLIVYEAPVSVTTSSRGHHWVQWWVLFSDALSLRDQAWFWVICCDLWQEDCVHLSALWSLLTPSSCG